MNALWFDGDTGSVPVELFCDSKYILKSKMRNPHPVEIHTEPNLLSKVHLSVVWLCLI